MDILLTVHKRDFYQQAVTAAVPPPYLVTGHQIRSQPPTYAAKKRKKKWESGEENLQRKQKANLQLKLEELYVNFNVFSFLCNILPKPLNQAGMTWKEWD